MDVWLNFFSVLLKGSGVIMARSKTDFCVVTMIAAIAAVEGTTGCASMDELHKKVAKKYAAEAPDGFPVLGHQTVKARIEELVESNQVTLITKPVARSGNGGVSSKKETMMNILNVENVRLANVVEKIGPDSEIGRELSSILDAYKRLADITASLHQRKPDENPENSEDSVVEPIAAAA